MILVVLGLEMLKGLEGLEGLTAVLYGHDTAWPKENENIKERKYPISNIQ